MQVSTMYCGVFFNASRRRVSVIENDYYISAQITKVLQSHELLIARRVKHIIFRNTSTTNSYLCVSPQRSKVEILLLKLMHTSFRYLEYRLTYLLDIFTINRKKM